MFKNLINKIIEFLFPSKSKMLASTNTNTQEVTSEIKKYEDNLEIEQEVDNLIKSEKINELSTEDLKKYIEYFKNKASYYTKENQLLDEEMKVLLASSNVQSE